MPRVILVHGMNADPSSWNTVPKLLRDKGYDVVNPTLPGHDKPLALKDLLRDRYTSGGSMQAYVDEVASHFPSGVADDTILVGHSMGGAVISHVAAQHSKRIAGLVYVAAMLPDAAQSAAALVDASAAASTGIESFISNFAPHVSKLKLVKQPKGPLGAAFNRTRDFEALGKGYILCKGDGVIPPQLQETMLEAYNNGANQIRVIRLDYSHLPQFDDANTTVEVIVSLFPMSGK